MAEDEIILGFKLMIMKRPDGSRYIKTKNKTGEEVTEQDMAVYGMYLDIEKRKLLDGFQPNIEIENVSEGLFDS